MLTDRKQTGVPNGNAFSLSGKRNRVQLVKPVQANNIGRSVPTFNPIVPAASAPRVPPVSAVNREPSALLIPTGGAAGNTGVPGIALPGASGAAVSPSSSLTADPIREDGMPVQTPSVSQRAREAIGGMTSAEIGALLDELASGRLRGVD